MQFLFVLKKTLPVLLGKFVLFLFLVLPCNHTWCAGSQWHSNPHCCWRRLTRKIRNYWYNLGKEKISPEFSIFIILTCVINKYEVQCVRENKQSVGTQQEIGWKTGFFPWKTSVTEKCFHQLLLCLHACLLFLTIQLCSAKTSVAEDCIICNWCPKMSVIIVFISINYPVYFSSPRCLHQKTVNVFSAKIQFTVHKSWTYYNFRISTNH